MKKIIIDCDTGIDDSIALLYALKRKDVQIMAITATFGNCSAYQSAINSLKMIELAKPDYFIPVYIGSEYTYDNRKTEYSTFVHGDNGIGDVDLPQPKQKPQPEYGVDALIDLIKANPHQITLVTLGRLTNIALAVKKAPEIVPLVKQLVFMGGTVYHCGNVAPFSEANIAGDALSSKIVLETGFNALQVGLDITQMTHLTRNDLNYLLKNASAENKAIAEYINQAMVKYFSFNHQASNMIDCCPLHDPLAMLIALNPQLAKVSYYPCTVETNTDSICHGMIVIDKRDNPISTEPIGFALECDSRKAVDLLISIFC
ncbi:MAG: nucleoside hydrolase [Erysipelotrichaceae bacterium]